MSVQPIRTADPIALDQVRDAFALSLIDALQRASAEVALFGVGGRRGYRCWVTLPDGTRLESRSKRLGAAVLNVWRQAHRRGLL